MYSPGLSRLLSQTPLDGLGVRDFLENSMRSLLRQQPPSDAEQRMFDVFALEARSLGASLLRGKRLLIPGGSALDLANPLHVEFALLSVKTGVKQHVRRGEDLLTLVDRVMGMIEASTRRLQTGLQTDVGLYVLR